MDNLIDERQFEDPQFELNDAMGVTQHHDSAPGTENQVVTNDYVRLLQAGQDANKVPYSKALERHVVTDPSYSHWEPCTEYNKTYAACPAYNANADEIAVTLINPSVNPVTLPRI